MNIERVREEIRNRAISLICDNPRRVGDLHFIETAMLIGASIVFEQPIEDTDEELKFTPETDELLRQLFEGGDKVSPFADRPIRRLSPEGW